MTRKSFHIALAVFVVLHQDAWLWSDASLILGFLPAGLAYHAAYSIATAGLWALATRYDGSVGSEAAEPPSDATRQGPQ